MLFDGGTKLSVTQYLILGVDNPASSLKKTNWRE